MIISGVLLVVTPVATGIWLAIGQKIERCALSDDGAASTLFVVMLVAPILWGVVTLVALRGHRRWVGVPALFPGPLLAWCALALPDRFVKDWSQCSVDPARFDAPIVLAYIGLGLSAIALIQAIVAERSSWQRLVLDLLIIPFVVVACILVWIYVGMSNATMGAGS
jgi:hypothetical protein